MFARHRYQPSHPRSGSGTCSFNIASPAAKRGNIYSCSPCAAMADACWVEAALDSVLCLSDPMSHRVVRLWMEGAIGAALPTGPAQYGGTPSPIRLDLDNGARCRLRNGGSWGIQESNPDLVGFYGCDKGGVVWASRDSRTGIDQSGKTWTVRTGKESGGLTRRKVREYPAPGSAGRLLYAGLGLAVVWPTSMR